MSFVFNITRYNFKGVTFIVLTILKANLLIMFRPIFAFQFWINRKNNHPIFYTRINLFNKMYGRMRTRTT